MPRLWVWVVVDAGLEEYEDYTKRLIRLGIGDLFRFKCTRCGRCCSGGPNVSLTVFDVVRMARFLSIGWKVFLRGYVKVIIADIVPHMLLRGDEQGRCLFLAEKTSGEKLCVIYPARPMRCRLYPVLVEDLSGKWVYLDPRSPGVGRGDLRPLPRRLIEHYIWERREHYRRLYRVIVDKGARPIEGLYRVLEDAWREAEAGAEWADLDYLTSLGSV